MRLILNTGKKIVPVLVLAVFVMVCALFFFNTSLVAKRAQAMLTQQLDRQLIDERVQIGGITLFPLNRVTLHQVKLVNGKDTLARAERVSVSFHLTDLLKGADGAVKSIKEIRVTKPEVNLVKGEKGFWFEKYLTKTSGKNTLMSFYPLIRITGGKVNYDDGKIAESVENLNGLLLFKKSSMFLNLNGAAKGLNHAKFVIKGTATPKMQLDISFNNVPFSALEHHYGITFEQAQKLAGQGSGTIRLEPDKHNNLSYSGQLTFANAQAEVHLRQLSRPVMFDQLAGQVTFTGENLKIKSLSGHMPAGRFNVHGELKKLSDPEMNLTVTTNAMQLATLFNLVPAMAKEKDLPQGSGSGTVQVLGNWQNPLIKGRIKAPAVRYRMMWARNVDGYLSYQNYFATIRDVKLDTAGGKAQIYNGYISFKDTDKFTYSLNAEGQNLDLAPLLAESPAPVPLKIFPTGKVAGKIYVSGEGANSQAVTVIGQVEVTKGHYQDMPFDLAKGNFWYTGGQVGLTKAQFVAPYARTVVSGKMDLDGDIKFNIEPTFVDLGWVGQQFKLPVLGKAFISGDVEGTVTNPQFVGDVTLEQGEAWGQKFDKVAGGVKVNKEELLLADTFLTRGNNNFKVSGKVGIAKQDLNLNAEVINSSLSDLKQMLEFMAFPYDISGDIQGGIGLKGPWSNIQVDGDLAAVNGVVMNQPYDRAQLAFHWQDKNITLKNFVVSYKNTQLHATGTINNYENLNIAMDGKQFDLTDIQELKDKVPGLEGKADFAGQISGTTKAPAFSGTIVSSSMKYNDIPIQNLSAVLGYNNDVLQIKPMQITNEESEYTLKGEIRLKEKSLELQVTPKHVKVTDLLRYANLPVKVLDYDLNGEVWVRGSFEQPKVELAVDLADTKEGKLAVNGSYVLGQQMDVKVKGTHFDLTPFKPYLKIDDFQYVLDGNAAVRGTLDDPDAGIQMTLTDGGGGSLAVNGVYNLNTGMNMKVESNRFDLRPFAGYLPTRQVYTGKVNLTGTVTGTPDKLNAAADISITGGSFNNYFVEKLGGSVKIVDSATVSLDQELVLPDGNQLKVKGSVPFPTREGSLDLDINASKGNLEILALLIPGVEQAGGGGQANFKLTGNWNEPEINGDISINSGFVKYQGFEAVKDIKGKISVGQGKINVDSLNARYGDGTINAKGSMTLDGFIPGEMNLSLKTKDFHFVYGSISAVGDADLKVKGPFMAPVIRGPITVHDAVVGVVPFVWAAPGSTVGVPTVGENNTPAETDKTAVDITNLSIGLGKIRGTNVGSEAGRPGTNAGTGSDATNGSKVAPTKESKFAFAPTFYLELYPGENVVATGANPLNMSINVLKNPTSPLVIDTTGGDVVLSGDLASRNGTFNFYNANFRVTRATASFVKFNKYIPILHVEAQADVDKYRVYLDLDGLPTESNLKLNLYSDPPLSERQVMALLANQGGLGELLEGKGNVTEIVSDEIWRFINQGLRNEFLNKLEVSVEKALHLDSFQVDPVLWGNTKVNLQVGKYVNEKLYVTYKRTFAQMPEQSLGFEYQLRRNISLEGSYYKRAEESGDFQLSVKANFPF